MPHKIGRSKMAFSIPSLRHSKGKVTGGGAAATIVIIIGAILILIIVNYAFPSTFSFLNQEKEGLTIYNITPIQGEMLMAATTSVGASYSDGSGAISSVNMLVDGSNVTSFANINSAGIRYDSNLGSGSHTVILTVADSAGNKLTKTWSFSINLDVEGAIAQALNEINSARQALGIYNVSLIQPVASTFRGEDMLDNQYFGHYDLNGLQPGYYYTKLGGL